MREKTKVLINLSVAERDNTERSLTMFLRLRVYSTLESNERLESNIIRFLI